MLTHPLLYQLGNHSVNISTIHTEVVLDFLHRLMTIGMGDQYPPTGTIRTPTLSTTVLCCINKNRFS